MSPLQLGGRFVSQLFACSDVLPQPATFIAYALHRTRLHPSVTFAALYLLQRLKSCFPATKGPSGHRLFLSAFMLASKIICDDTYSNKSSPFPCPDVPPPPVPPPTTPTPWLGPFVAHALRRTQFHPFAALYLLQRSCLPRRSSIICDDTYSNKSSPFSLSRCPASSCATFHNPNPPAYALHWIATATRSFRMSPFYLFQCPCFPYHSVSSFHHPSLPQRAGHLGLSMFLPVLLPPGPTMIPATMWSFRLTPFCLFGCALPLQLDTLLRSSAVPPSTTPIAALLRYAPHSHLIHFR